MPRRKGMNMIGSDKGFEPLAPGYYLVRVDQCIDGISKGAKTAGAEQDKYTLRVIEPEECYDSPVFLTITHGSAPSHRQLHDLLVATGEWTTEEIAVDSFNYDTEDVIGEEVVVFVTQREWDGRMTNDIKGIYPASTWSEHAS